MKARTGRVAVIGTTDWGTTLAIMLSRNGLDVSLWARTEAEAEKLNLERENTARLPGFSFPDGLRVTASLGEALYGAGLVILAVPSQSMRHNVRLIKEHLNRSLFILSVAKGLEVDSVKRMSWPATAAKPAAISPVGVSVIYLARRTAITPLSTSATSTIAPYLAPRVRRTLVVPILPLPNSRISIPRSFPMTIPEGIEPIR